LDISVGLAKRLFKRDGESLVVTRKSYSAEQKVTILREHLIENRPVSDVCDQYQISPAMFYRWQRKLFAGGHPAFERNPVKKRQDAQINRFEEKLRQKDKVIGELMGGYVALKKVLGTAEWQVKTAADR